MAQKNLPEWYQSLKDQFPDYLDSLEALGNAVRQAGPLDEKAVQLIQLAAAAAIRSEGAVHSHVRRSLEVGISKEEIYHALIMLTSTIGFPNVSAALSWATDIIKK
jgi:4-carboxymuconolactone decarboxylase